MFILISLETNLPNVQMDYLPPEIEQLIYSFLFDRLASIKLELLCRTGAWREFIEWGTVAQMTPYTSSTHPGAYMRPFTIQWVWFFGRRPARYPIVSYRVWETRNDMP